MPRLTPGDVHVDVPMTNWAIKWMNRTKNIGTKLLPIYPVKKEIDKYYEWAKADWLRNEVEKIAAGDPAPRQGFGLSSESYDCEEYGLGTDLPERVKNNADSVLRMQFNKTAWVTDQVLKNREILIAANIFSAAIWTNTSTPTHTWDDETNSNPITDLFTAINSVEDNAAGIYPNKGAMGVEVWRKLQVHPQVIRCLYGEGSNTATIVTPQLLAKFLGLDEILIGRGVKETAAEGATSSEAKIWGKHCWVGYVAPRATMDMPTAGWTFQVNFRIKSWFEQHTGNDVFEAREIIDVKQVANDCGYLLASVVA